MIPPENVIPERVHHGFCTGARISFRYEMSKQYHVHKAPPLVSEQNRPLGGLEREAHAQISTIIL